MQERRADRSVAAELAQVSSNRMRQFAAPHNPGPTVLLVDDDCDLRTFLFTDLRTHGLNPILARSGTESLELACAERIDIVLIDPPMRGVDGYEVCERLMRDAVSAPVPIIVLGVMDDLPARQRALQLGVADFLSKPVNTRELMHRIGSQLHMLGILREMDAAIAAWL